MKNMMCHQIGVLVLLAGICISCNTNKTQDPTQKDRIVLNSSPGLYELTSEWAAVYCKLNPEMDIEVLKISESTSAEDLENTAQLSFITRDFAPDINDRALWKVCLGRDIIVPFINDQNPYIQEIYKQGISPAGLARILNNPEKTRWSTLIENAPDVPVSLYIKDDVSLLAGISKFLETDQLAFSDKYTRDSKELVGTVQNDEYALGICYLADMINPQNQMMYSNVKILPIDKNGNGYIDSKEDVYASLDEFARGVWIGKYPRTLANNIYTVSSTPPALASEQAFLTWVLTRGHVLLDNHGFSTMPEFERLAQVKIIDGIGDGRSGPGSYTLPKEPGFFTRPLTYILAFLLLMTVLMYYSLRLRNRRSKGISVQGSFIPGPAINLDQVKVSPGLYYDKTHTWAFMDKDGSVKVGIDDFLQLITGPLTRVKMKSPGERVKKGMKALSIIQDGKQLDICAPVSGTIMEQNTHLHKDSSLLNSSPHAEGWIYKIEPANWVKEVQFLIMGNSYKLWLKKEFQRLKEFLADTLRTENAGYVQVLQDGGELRENILKDLGPETWEDFQTNFMDVSS
jgi:glycine cleavage system H lipoate-binding protein/ABC-type phosphate transport system substrate-binding protein